MRSNKQSEMVNHTLYELLYRNSSTKVNKKRMVLALLTSHLIGMEEGLQYVKNLRNGEVSVLFSADDSLLAEYPLTQLINLIENDNWLSKAQLQDRILDKVDAILIPIFSFSMATNILLLHDQNPFVRFILKALFSGKKVIGLKTGIDPYHPLWTINGLDKGSHFLKRKMSNQIAELKSMGIQLINEQDSFITSNREIQSKSVITEKTIRYYHQQNDKKLFISRETIITPLALDTAKELAISVIKQ